MKKLLVLTALVFAGFSNLALSQEVRTVANVDLTRYVGNWYEVARFPNHFQKDCAANVTAQYNKRADGEIDVINRCKKADGKIDEVVGRARVDNSQTNAKLKVSFASNWLNWLPFIWADYWIIDLAQDYSLVAVSDASRDYLWVLSRTPGIADADYEALVNRVTAQGFDTARLVKTVQEKAAK
ncbi:lipocalin family protein [Herminiimonas fonticola]|uniref:Outer membrane lipoprotein Blc n=1 Tax=Herminiimonas fonticola TaxID=303380 RepID=A0A4R6GFV4_9BURK|nr:lipocalin family protein [Herminiimonas fonticola]RBA24615.1 Bacterial lipocalin [Herminiimonas fonticola]TDN93732.1 apolipoprotein D and lipocalin family protein [Herminiimonas fonticola]